MRSGYDPPPRTRGWYLAGLGRKAAAGVRSLCAELANGRFAITFWTFGFGLERSTIGHFLPFAFHHSSPSRVAGNGQKRKSLPQEVCWSRPFGICVLSTDGLSLRMAHRHQIHHVHASGEASLTSGRQIVDGEHPDFGLD